MAEVGSPPEAGAAGGGGGWRAGGVGKWNKEAVFAAFNIPDAIVCLGGFVASLCPQQSVPLSSHIYIDSLPQL